MHVHISISHDFARSCLGALLKSDHGMHFAFNRKGVDIDSQCKKLKCQKARV